MATTTVQRSKWGRARFGGGTALLLGLSAFGGLLLAAAMGALFGWLVSTERQLLGSVLFAGMVFPITCALFWACLVDLKSLRGAVENTEDTVENHWYNKAAAATFTDLLLVLGIGATIFSFAPIQANIGLVLGAVILLAMADFGLRYRLFSRAQG